MKRGAPLRRTPLVANPAKVREWRDRNRRPLPQVSAKRRAEQPARQAAVAQARSRDGGCVAERLWPEVACAGRLVGHEPGRRRGDGAHLDADRIVTLCWSHHEATHAEPALAYERGLLVRTEAHGG